MSIAILLLGEVRMRPSLLFADGLDVAAAQDLHLYTLPDPPAEIMNPIHGDV